MEKKERIIDLKIDHLRQGMKIADDVENRFGGVLIPSGTIIMKEQIRKLIENDIEEVKIYLQSGDDIKENIEKTTNPKKVYKKDIEKSKSLYRNVKNRYDIEYDDVRDLTEDAETLSKKLKLSELISLVQKADLYTYSHLLNTGVLANKFADWLNLSDKKKRRLTVAGILHDIGKSQIPDKILNKPEDLSKEEFAKIKDHVAHGYNILKKQDLFAQEIVFGVLTHHERYDGSGYPLGMKGKDIPLFGRVLAIIDAFDAITSERFYQSAVSPFKAVRIIKEESFTDFDYELKNIFIRNITDFLKKEKVKLSNGEIARVVYIDNIYPDQPLVEKDDGVIDLKNSPDLEIVELLE
ncbi:MAG: HD-GYP domain-containing protein [bacterium]